MKKLLATALAMLMLIGLLPIMAGAVDAQPITKDAPPAGYVNVTLSAYNVWGDGTGYQMLLDADAAALGTIIPVQGPLTNSGSSTQAVYDNFEYKIPEDADWNINTSNVVSNGSETIQIPVGVYDYCLVNPTPGDRMWIASGDNGRRDNYAFLEGFDYEFVVTLDQTTGNDSVSITLTPIDPNQTLPPTPTPAPAGNLSAMNTTDLDGNSVTGAIFGESNITVLNMWANWCNPCIQELPALQQLSETYSVLGVKVIGCLVEGTAAQGHQLLDNAGATYLNIFPDTVIQSQILVSMQYFPTTYIIDSNGNILDQYTEIGSQSYAQYAQFISGVLNDLGFPSDPHNPPSPTPPTTEEPAPTPTPIIEPTPTVDPENPTPNPNGLAGFDTEDIYGEPVTGDMLCAEGINLTFMNLWAHWCGPCMSELPDIQRIHEEFSAEGNTYGVQVLGVVGGGTTAAQARTVAEQKGLTYTNVMPDNILTSRFSALSQYIPFTVFVDNTGTILSKYNTVGSMSYNTMRAKIVTIMRNELGIEVTPVPATPAPTPTATPAVTPTPTQTYEIGDANLDGAVNTGDAAMILRFAAQLDTFSELQMSVADYNEDGDVNTGDAAAILKFIAFGEE